MSTIGVAGIERVAAMDAERPDVTLLDAPVSGSKVPAEQGQLTIFASGPDEARSRPDDRDDLRPTAGGQRDAEIATKIGSTRRGRAVPSKR
jgi:hypothetical protein